MAQVFARSELILGGQKSGKSARAEQLAVDWLASSASNEALLIATALGGDSEMQSRIERHRQQRSQRVPAMQTLEEPRRLAQMLTEHSLTKRMLVIDCITLWLTNLLMPLDQNQLAFTCTEAEHQANQLCLAIASAPGPVVLVSNEIGGGVVPMGEMVRIFVDTLGLVNQRLGSTCERVSYMFAGQTLMVKGVSA
jgi:adenosylcobinamide kinase/adenosylcobinamide-phosphate guanylyltransferase